MNDSAIKIGNKIHSSNFEIELNISNRIDEIHTAPFPDRIDKSAARISINRKQLSNFNVDFANSPDEKIILQRMNVSKRNQVFSPDVPCVNYRLSIVKK